MRGIGELFPSIVSMDNLFWAFRKAARGKSENLVVLRFAANLEGELARIRDDLLARTFSVGQARQFKIFDPKERIISAP